MANFHFKHLLAETHLLNLRASSRCKARGNNLSLLVFRLKKVV